MDELTNAAFYLAACAAFLVLLTAGVFAELTGDDDKERDQHVTLVVVALGIVVLCGEMVALYVLLLSQQAPGWAQVIVSWALLAGFAIVFGAAVRAVRRRGKTVPAGRIQAVATLGAIVVAAGVVAVLYALDVKGFATTLIKPSSNRLEPGQFYVVGTCAATRCKLYERLEPNRDRPHVGEWRDGEVVKIVCQIEGDRIVHPVTGDSTFVWNKLDNGHYVTDLFVQTPGDPWTHGLPRCL